MNPKAKPFTPQEAPSPDPIAPTNLVSEAGGGCPAGQEWSTTRNGLVVFPDPSIVIIPGAASAPATAGRNAAPIIKPTEVTNSTGPLTGTSSLPDADALQIFLQAAQSLPLTSTSHKPVSTKQAKQLVGVPEGPPRSFFAERRSVATKEWAPQGGMWGKWIVDIRAHALQHEWVLWYDTPQMKKEEVEDWFSNLRPWAINTTAEEFWMNFLLPSECTVGCNLHYFKRGVKPMWEDGDNAYGGEWEFAVPKGEGDAMWEKMLMLAVGETIDPTGDLITGCVYSSRRSGDRISLWVSRQKDRDEVNELGIQLRRHVAPPTELRFHRHSDCIANPKGFRTADVEDPFAPLPPAKATFKESKSPKSSPLSDGSRSPTLGDASPPPKKPSPKAGSWAAIAAKH